MKKFLFLFGFLLPFLGVAYMNWYDYPVEVYKSGIFGIHYRRMNSSYLAEKVKPEAIFMGSSRTQIFKGQTFVDYGYSPALNMAIPRASIMETRYYFEHAENTRPLKTALVELNLIYFTEETQVDFSKHRMNIAENSESLRGRLWYRFRFARDVYFTLMSKSFVHWTLVHANERKYNDFNIFLHPLDEFAGTVPTNAAPVLTEEAYEHFRAIVRIAVEKGTKLRLYIPPIMAHTEEEYYGDRQEELDQWKRTLMSIITEEAGQSDVQLWDFSGYNPITEDSSGDNPWFDNPAHMKPDYANLIFRRIYGTCKKYCGFPDYLGVQLTPDNLEEQLELRREARAEYLRTHAGESQKKETPIEEL